MPPPQRVMGAASLLSWLCLAASMAPVTIAAAAPAKTRHPAAASDVAHDFRALAQQRPWECAHQPPDVGAPAGWSGGVAQCAWQERLSVRQWRTPNADLAGKCVSGAAKWWAWARGGSAAAMAWQRDWRTQVVLADAADEKRVVLIEAVDATGWQTTEWRWKPSPRAPTRRWQESRWALLLARASGLRSPDPALGPEAARLESVLAANLGRRPGERHAAVFSWPSDDLCMRAEAVLPMQQLNLSYAVDDSRMEQRAAVQLQLARRFPKATWLTTFSLLPPTPNVRGGAKFLAIWHEPGQVSGQLWIPAKANGPLVRLRVQAAVAPGGADSPAVARAHQAMQRELTGLAARWAFQHD